MPPAAPRELLQFLKRYDAPVQELALAARTLLHEELAPCHEFVYDMRSKVVLIYSATTRVIADAICHVPVFAKHVTLVFPQGADMPDPSGLLRGTGKIMRHVRIERLADLERPGIAPLLREARKIAGMKPRKPGERAEIVTTFKRAPAARKSPANSRWPDRFF